MRAFLLSIATVFLLAGLCSCEYPEQGYFELVGLDEDGRQTGRILFIVEEYVDDSEMTTGFGLLLPHVDGDKLVRVPMQNREGFDARGWDIHTNGGQTGIGNMILYLTHYDERLKLQGSIVVPGLEGQQDFHGNVRSEDGITSILFVGGAPQLPDGIFAETLDWQIRRLGEESFEALCGLNLDSPVVPLEKLDMHETGEAPAIGREQASDPGPDRGNPPPKPEQ